MPMTNVFNLKIPGFKALLTMTLQLIIFLRTNISKLSEANAEPFTP